MAMEVARVLYHAGDEAPTNNIRWHVTDCVTYMTSPRYLATGAFDDVGEDPFPMGQAGRVVAKE